jgi:hypothetical protein
MGAHAQASPASPFAMGEVDGGMVQYGGTDREAARDGVRVRRRCTGEGCGGRPCAAVLEKMNSAIFFFEIGGETRTRFKAASEVSVRDVRRDGLSLLIAITMEASAAHDAVG